MRGAAQERGRAYGGGGLLVSTSGRKMRAELEFPFLRGWTFDLFWVVFLMVLTRVTLLPDLNSLAWAAADGMTLYALAKHPTLYAETIRRNALLLSWPAIALLSSVWSLMPELTFYHAIQFALNSFVAFVLMRHAGLGRLVRILFFFNLAMQGMSLILLLIHSGPILDEAGNFKGVYIHKNELGVFSTLQIICGSALFLSGWKKWLSGAGVALALMMLVKSGSGTSTVLSAFILGLYPLFLIMRRGLAPAGITISLAIALTAGVALIILVMQFDVVNFILFSLGKDPGLTGRDMIWTLGFDAALSRPWLGHGFLAYWASGESTSAYLRYVLKQDLLAFHNVYLETAVAFGFMGPILLVCGLVQQILRGFVYLMRRGDIIAMTPLLFFLWITVLCMSENPIFWNSQLHFLLMCFAAATCGAQSNKS